MRDSKSSIIKHVVVGLLISVLLVSLEMLIGSTYWGHRVKLFALELLQGQLTSFNPEEKLPIVVVDVSEIERDNNLPVNLETLEKVIKAVADQKPRAIAVDIVLIPKSLDSQSPEYSSTKLTPKEAEAYHKFLEFCLQLKENGTPIFLGVGKRSVAPPKYWLDGEKYNEMAASVMLDSEDSSRMLLWLKADPAAEPLFSIGAALSRAYNETYPPAGLSWALEKQGNLPGRKSYLQGNVEYAYALVNYSKLEAIENGKLSASKESTIRDAGAKLRGRMVILGDGDWDKAVDKSAGPPRAGSVPGVYLHACAAYTFSREPLYELKLSVRLLLNLLFSILVLLWVAIARYRHRNEKRIFNWGKLQFKLTIGISLVVLLAAVLLVRWVGVLWLDFLLVAFALLLHPKIEKLVIPENSKRA